MSDALLSLSTIQTARERRAEGLACRAAAAAVDARDKKHAARLMLLQNECAAVDAWGMLSGSSCSARSGHGSDSHSAVDGSDPDDAGEGNVRRHLAPTAFHRYAARLTALRAQRVELLASYQRASRAAHEADAAAREAARGWTKIKVRARQLRERLQRQYLDRAEAAEQDSIEDSTLRRWYADVGAGLCAPLDQY